METTEFDREIAFAMQQGLTPSQAFECIAFMNKRFPEDLRRHTVYYTRDWIHRWKNDPVAYMDDVSLVTYSLVQTTTAVFVESI